MLRLYPFDEYLCTFNFSMAKTLHTLSNNNRVKFNMTTELQKPLLTGNVFFNYLIFSDYLIYLFSGQKYIVDKFDFYVNEFGHLVFRFSMQTIVLTYTK